MTADPWQPYRPTPEDPWDLKKVGHLHRRAGFGATWAELQRDLKAGSEASIDRLLAGEVDPEADAESDYLASERSLPAGADTQSLAAWWLARILRSPHPLREKLTLFWHGHFATSNAKVQNARLMLGQYRLLNRHALGDFRELLRQMATDPAMLVWLDGAGSVAGKPNENYARELMELFALGIGHYTEFDIREAAKAFTGWDVRGGVAVLNQKRHDAGDKVVFGRKGKYGPDDVTRLVLEKRESHRFVCQKLYRFLVSEAAEPTPDLLDPLAEKYAAGGFDTGKLVETILRSRHFFSDAAYRQKVKSPVEFAVGLVRGVGGPVGGGTLAAAVEPLGQVLFAPPSVKGWDGGPAWLNAQTLLARQNLALAMCSGEDARFRRCDPATLPADALDVFLQGDVPAATRDRLASAPVPKPRPYQPATDPKRSRAALVLTLPEFQLN